MKGNVILKEDNSISEKIRVACNMLGYLILVLRYEKNIRKELLIWFINDIIGVLEKITAD